MKKLFSVIDGWKRVIMLALTLLQIWLLKAQGIDIGAQVGFAYGLLGWDPAQIGISFELLMTTAAGVLAIVDGVVKAVRNDKADQAAKLAKRLS